MTNQFTDEQLLAALNAYSGKGLEIDGYIPDEGFPSLDEWGDRFTKQIRAALEAAAGIAPQAESERESDKECPHTPRDEWRRRGYCHRCTVEAGWTLLSDQEARRELPVQPSSTVDEDALAEVIRRSYENEQGLKIRDDKRTARAVAEWLRGESR